MNTPRNVAKAKVDFRIHLITYVAVIGLLVIINLLKSPENIWFIWPLLGWGIAIVIHALKVYYFSGDKSLKERMIEKEIERSNY